MFLLGDRGIRMVFTIISTMLVPSRLASSANDVSHIKYTNFRLGQWLRAWRFKYDVPLFQGTLGLSLRRSDDILYSSHTSSTPSMESSSRTM